MRVLGKVKGINLYPVKSMRAVPVMKADLYWYGLNGDRKYAFVKRDKTSGFPWLTARELPELLKFQSHFEDKNGFVYETNPIQVTTPEGTTYPLASKDLLTELEWRSSLGLSLLHLNRGTYDVAPVSLITTGTLRFLEQQFGTAVDVRRFRMNLLIDSEELRVEESWLGQTLRFGDSAEIRPSHRDKRCMMIGLDPDSAVSDPSVLKTVATSMDACVGVYADVTRCGRVSVGDTVYLT